MNKRRRKKLLKKIWFSDDDDRCYRCLYKFGEDGCKTQTWHEDYWGCVESLEECPHCGAVMYHMSYGCGGSWYDMMFPVRSKSRFKSAVKSNLIRSIEHDADFDIPDMEDF